MQFIDTAIPGVCLVEFDTFADDRGSLSPMWIPSEFAARGLETTVAQLTLAANHRRGTLRGLHYQTAPHQEVKCVRVVRGAVFDVALDLRPDSPTYRRWFGAELTTANRRMLYIPKGFAHGYQTLTDDTEILYVVSAPYSPAHQRGVRWNDPTFGIEWPLGPPSVIHPRDASYPDVDA